MKVSCARRPSSSVIAGLPRLLFVAEDSELVGSGGGGGGGVARTIRGATPRAACAAATEAGLGNTGAEEGPAVTVLARRGMGYDSPRATAACRRSSASALVGRPRFFLGGSVGSLGLTRGAPSGLG